MFNLAWRDKCALIALIFGLLACTQPAPQTGAAKPSPIGTWEIKGNDAAQTTWIGSMALTAGDKGAITGHIDWFASGGPVQEKSMELVRALNGCDGAGEQWSKGPKATGTLYPSKTGTPLVWVVHPGGHEVPQAGGRLIARFFKENAKLLAVRPVGAAPGG